MNITIIRNEKPDKTPGEMLVDGKHFGWTLEDPVRDHNADGDLDDEGEGKVYGDTAIPYATYQIKITYSPTFKKSTPQLFNTPGGKIRFGKDPIDLCGVRIHGGNTKENTLGCPLLGALRKPNLDVYDCKAINELLITRITEALKTGPVFLTIKRP